MCFLQDPLLRWRMSTVKVLGSRLSRPGIIERSKLTQHRNGTKYRKSDAGSWISDTSRSEAEIPRSGDQCILSFYKRQSAAIHGTSFQPFGPELMAEGFLISSISTRKSKCTNGANRWITKDNFNNCPKEKCGSGILCGGCLDFTGPAIILCFTNRQHRANGVADNAVGC